MRLTVIGKSPAWSDVGGACSGYLVEHGTVSILVDCGNGVFGRLREVVDYLTVDAVVISHLHADHCFDIVPYAYALANSPRQRERPGGPARPRLLLPTGGRAILTNIARTWNDETLIERTFDVDEYVPGVPLKVGVVGLHFAAVPHYVPTCAIELQVDNRRITYGADCAPNDALPELATGSDLMLVEATLREPENGPVRGHLTALEAGQHGRRAEADRLVIVHYSDELDRDEIRRNAAYGFGDDVTLAEAGARYEL